CGRKRSAGRQAVRDKGGAASEGSRNRRVEAGSPPDDPGESPAQVSGCGAVPIRLSNQIEGTRSVRPGQKDGENRRQFHGGSQQAEIPRALSVTRVRRSAEFGAFTGFRNGRRSEERRV